MSSLSIAAIGRILEETGTSWALIGGHAVNVWVEPRATADIDITVAADPAGLERLRRALEAAGLRVELDLGAEQPSGPDFIRLVSADRAVVLEVQHAKTRLQASLLDRAVRHGDVRVATVEDLLVLKLIAYRSKDRADLVSLARLPALDWAYVETHARAWGVYDRLARLRDAFD